jgi:hypothetical protein
MYFMTVEYSCMYIVQSTLPHLYMAASIGRILYRIGNMFVNAVFCFVVAICNDTIVQFSIVNVYKKRKFSNSCCLLNQNTAYVVTADHNCHHFLFISVGVNCYTFTCYNYVQLTKGLRELRKCKKRINQYGHCCRCHHKPRSHT